MQRYPDYPRDESGDIPEPGCYDLLAVWADHGGVPMWDMNGVACSLECVTGRDDEPLDQELDEWADWYDRKPIGGGVEPIWDSEEEQIEFDRRGEILARKVYDFFGGTRTIVYRPTRGGEIRWDAKGKPPIRR